MKKFFLALMMLAFCFLISGSALAATKIEQISDTGDHSDFVAGPGKVEYLLDPGQTVTKNITVTNRFDREKKFKIDLEDFQGDKTGERNVVLMGLTKGPYSLKDYIKPEVMEFKLQPGDRISIPVKISIPQDAVPGGLYGSVIVSVVDDPDDPQIDPNKVDGGIIMQARLVILYFIRVKGIADENGKLKDFRSSHWLNFNPAVELSYAFENTGNVYLDPKGFIEIKNMYGSAVDRLDILPYYVLPGALRINKLNWSKGFMMGRYTAKITLDQGYLDKKAEPDTKTIAFWVIPWKVILGIIIGLIIVLAIARGIKNWLKKNFQRRK